MTIPSWIMSIIQEGVLPIPNDAGQVARLLIDTSFVPGVGVGTAGGGWHPPLREW